MERSLSVTGKCGCGCADVVTVCYAYTKPNLNPYVNPNTNSDPIPNHRFKHPYTSAIYQCPCLAINVYTFKSTRNRSFQGRAFPVSMQSIAMVLTSIHRTTTEKNTRATRTSSQSNVGEGRIESVLQRSYIHCSKSNFPFLLAVWGSEVRSLIRNDVPMRSAKVSTANMTSAARCRQ